MTMQFDGSPLDADPFTDPNIVVQVEDESAESLAGEEVDFDPDSEEEGGPDGEAD